MIRLTQDHIDKLNDFLTIIRNFQSKESGLDAKFSNLITAIDNSLAPYSENCKAFSQDSFTLDFGLN
tara:strand:+ start:672 stop:872 length:201 start_codon:yes stop_codon:yes gene_type:complete